MGHYCGYSGNFIRFPKVRQGPFAYYNRTQNIHNGYVWDAECLSDYCWEALETLVSTRLRNLTTVVGDLWTS